MTQFLVIVEDRVIKYLDKLPRNIAKYFFKRFDKLETDKKGYKKLFPRHNGQSRAELWELRCDNHRVYYIVQNDEIFVSSILYDGTIRGIQAGTKDTQDEQIRALKEKYF